MPERSSNLSVEHTEAQTGLRLAANFLSLRSPTIAADSIAFLPIPRLAVFSAAGKPLAISPQLSDDLGLPVNLDDAIATDFGIAAPLLREWTALADAALHGSHCVMAYQVLGGKRCRLVFLPMATATGVRTATIAMLASRTLCGDDVLIDATSDPVHCCYATLGRLNHLTLRELDVLRLLGFDLRRREIAGHLRCSAVQLRAIIAQLRKKLGMADTFKLSVLALRIGLTDVDDRQWGRTVFLRQGTAVPPISSPMPDVATN